MMRSASQKSSRGGSLTMRIFQSVNNILHNPVLRHHHNRTQRREVGFCRTAIIHGHAEESGVAEGFYVRGHFFHMTPKRFFSCVDAGHDLQLRSLGLRRRLGHSNGHRIQCSMSQLTLKREMENSTTLKAGEAINFSDQFRPCGLRQFCDRLRGPAMNLSQLKNQISSLVIG